jgi:hypothetical protein
VECLLQSSSTRQGIGGPQEYGEPAVTFAARPHEHAIMPGHYLLDNLVVPAHGCPRLLRMLLPQNGATLYVGE